MNIPFPKRVRIFCFLLFAAAGLRAQDPHFSQYYNSPWNLNPALTGLFNGSWRASLIYRDQWNSILEQEPFRTYSAAFDMRLPVGRFDYVGVGMGFLHDEAGTARYVQNNGQLGLAYLRRLSGPRKSVGHHLGAGIQAGFGRNSVDWSRLWFSRQYDPNAEAPDFSAGNGEPNANTAGKLWPDLNAGVVWYTLFRNDGYLLAGAALHHINQPAISLIDDEGETLFRRQSAQLMGQFPLNDAIALQPGALWMAQGPAQQFNLGANIRYGNNDYRELALRAGAWLRAANRLDRGLHADAVIITGIFEWERWTMGLSYDITVSSLTRANNSRGAFEINLRYIHPGTRRSRVECPSL